jgi:hypothetical protein
MRAALALATLLLAAGAARADTPAAGTPPAAPAVSEGAERPLPPVAARGPTTVVGLTGKTIVVTPQVLDGLRRGEATMINHGAPHTYEGVMLTELLRLVGAPTGARIHAAADRDYVVITGADGFRAVFSLAETDRSVQARNVILADHMDGAPLTDHDAPFRVVVDGDQKPSRSVSAVTKIEVKAIP